MGRGGRGWNDLWLSCLPNAAWLWLASWKLAWLRAYRDQRQSAGAQRLHTPESATPFKIHQLAPFPARNSSEGRYGRRNVSITTSGALGLWHALFGTGAGVQQDREDGERGLNASIGELATTDYGRIGSAYANPGTACHTRPAFSGFYFEERREPVGSGRVSAVDIGQHVWPVTLRCNQEGRTCRCHRDEYAVCNRTRGAAAGTARGDASFRATSWQLHVTSRLMIRSGTDERCGLMRCWRQLR